MKKTDYLLIMILVTAGFGILGYAVGESFQKTTDGNQNGLLADEVILGKGFKTDITDSEKYIIKIKN